MTSSPVRVLHVITRLIRGGADENTILTVERMDPARWDSHILAGRGSEIDRFPAGVRARTRVLDDLVREPNPVRDVLALAKLVRILRRERWDLVHTHTAKAGVLGRLAARAAGVPHVVHTVHGVTFHEHVSKPMRLFYVGLERLAAGRCDALITVGEDVKRKYLAEGIGRAEQYVTIPSGMDLEPFEAARREGADPRREVRAQLGIAPDDVVVGMVSRLEPRKGWTFLLEAVARLAPDFPSLRVLGVGEGAQRAELEAISRRLGIERRVLLVGYRADVARVIAAFDVGVLTSLWEGLPRVLVQYAMLEKPVVAFDVEGAREVVADGATGWIVAPRDVEALTDRLRRLAGNPQLRAAFGRRGRARVEGRWDADLMIRRIADVYEAVAAGRSPESPSILPEEAVRT
jgi:glycosyltransferase involved in cell wall biosynthesis